MRDAVRAGFATWFISTQASGKKREYECRCKNPKKRCLGYDHFIKKGDLEKANEHYNEKNAAGEWVKAVPPEGDPVEFIKVTNPGHGLMWVKKEEA